MRQNLQDLAERKIWSVPGVTAKVVADSGASVVSGPAVQMLEVVSKGVVDGYLGMPQSEVTQYKLTGYTKSATIFDEKIFQATFSFFVSRDKWEAISEEDRAAIQAALGGDFPRWMGARQDEIFAKANQEMQDEGVTFLPGDDAFLADLKSLGQAAIDEWKSEVSALGIDGDAVLADYQRAHTDAQKAGQ